MVFVSLLDCSAAFDLVDHSTLLHWLEHRLRVTGNPLDWFRSYLSERTQFVSTNGSTSPAHQLSCGVPQGSVLGPRLFTIYTQPLGDIIGRHDVNFHLYADDTQLYLACKHAACPQIHCETLLKLEACIAETWQWMPLNGLKLNDNKTEFMLIQSNHSSRTSSPNISIGSKPTYSLRPMARPVFLCWTSQITISHVFSCFIMFQLVEVWADFSWQFHEDFRVTSWTGYLLWVCVLRIVPSVSTCGYWIFLLKHMNSCILIALS